MTTSVVKLPYAPQQLIEGFISGGNNLSFETEVPADAKPGAVGSVSLAPDADFNACVCQAGDSTTFKGDYRDVAQTMYFQIASDPPNVPKPGSVYPFQVNAGELLYTNITIAHDGKQGGGNWPAPKRIRAECRAAQ